MKLSVKARIVIESDWYKEHFPDVVLSKDNNTKIEYTTTTGGLRYCTSTGGSVTGEGADILLIDDPQNPRLARSEVERENANDFLNESLRSRFDNPQVGMFIIIMQRLHENDNTGMVLDLEPEEWKHICLPAEVSENVRPIHLKENYVDGLLFAKRLSVKILASLRRGLGSYGYSGQYDQLPSPADGGIIKGSWFTIVESIKDRNFNHVPIESLTWDFLFDTAYTAKQENDPSAMGAMTYFEDNLYIRDMDSVRLEFPELVKEIPVFLNRNGYDNGSIGYVEPKASGKSVVQHLKANTSINIVESEAPTMDKVSRANAVAPFIQSGRVFLLKGNWNKPFVDQCNAFPNGTHDDEVDVLIMGIDELTQQDDFYII
jgi:predicted phage terminase large subunit-like protein